MVSYRSAKPFYASSNLVVPSWDRRLSYSILEVRLCGISTTVSVSACHAGDVSSILICRSNLNPKEMTNKDRLLKGLKVLLTIVLFGLPIVSTVSIWNAATVPEVREILDDSIIAVSVCNLILSLAEVIFLVRAVVFPPKEKRWWWVK